MRVIAGKAKRLQLKSPEGLEVRPTTDRIKETLFNMINTDLYEAIFLDVFSGSGAIAIEALSRGAKRAVLIERHPEAIKCIKENLAHTRLEEQASVYAMEALMALDKLKTEEVVFDIVFMDPPYGQGLELKVLEFLSQTPMITPSTQIIVESDLKTTFDSIEDKYYVEKVKQYKTNQHVFIRMR